MDFLLIIQSITFVISLICAYIIKFGVMLFIKYDLFPSWETLNVLASFYYKANELLF